MINLTSIRIMIPLGYSPQKWSEAPRLSMRTAIRDSTHALLHRLHLSLFRHVPIEDLASLANLKALSLADCTLCEKDTNRTSGGKDLRDAHLEFLELRRTKEDSFESHIITPLLARGEQGRFLLPLAHLKSFDTEVHSIASFESLIHLMEQHRVTGLEHLGINICMTMHNFADIPGGDCSLWLDRILLPQEKTLKSLKIETSIYSIYQDPLSGLCKTLGRFASDNPMEKIVILATVQVDGFCAVGEEWHELTRVLTNGNWSHMKEVELGLVVQTFYRPRNAHNELIRSLEELPATYLKPLCSQSFAFEFMVTNQYF
ncbi:hypothetical protein CVT24_005842 [Panaeolus cyanescens]|uniref:F-box domain-containing protein n=1 Tax=Panaeolus cyanescens TaxID=181874 RepID=A0A409YF32_9AGAR|nr:hypothetical protein CVT24_005842 [Panaeolus cyanescens]